MVCGDGRLVTRADKLCRERGWMAPEWEMAPRENDRDSRGAMARPIMEKNVEGLKKKLP